MIVHNGLPLSSRSAQPAPSSTSPLACLGALPIQYIKTELNSHLPPLLFSQSKQHHHSVNSDPRPYNHQTPCFPLNLETTLLALPPKSLPTLTAPPPLQPLQAERLISDLHKCTSLLPACLLPLLSPPQSEGAF